MVLSPESSAVDIRQFIAQDEFLFSFYERVYRWVAKELIGLQTSQNVEIGSGVGLGKLFMPDLTTSDVEMNEFLDMRVDGGTLPFPPSSVGNFVLVNSFHHLPSVTDFLGGAEKALVPGGRLLIVDPYWGPLASFVYSTFHRESFRPLARQWDSHIHDPWESNQALAWIVFRRDSRLFESLFPQLRIVSIQPFSGWSYLFSGGVFGRTRVNSQWLLRLAKREESWGFWYTPFRLFVQVVVEKRSISETGS